MLTSLATQTSNAEPILIIIFFGLFAFIANWIMYLKGFFKLQPLSVDLRRWSLIQCSVCVGIYLANALFIAPFLFHLIMNLSSSMKWALFQTETTRLILLQTLNITANIALLLFYLAFQKKGAVLAIWKDPQMKTSSSYFYDVLIGFFTWFISFPLIVAVNSLCELINHLLFQWEEVDQVAVKFLKLSTSSFVTVAISIAMIILAAPWIEEFIFRGCLQNWMRRYMGSKIAIIGTSIVFAMMHYAPSQSKSNFPLIASLFVFSLYLGFLYEKTRSLLAPIVLHMTFNIISVIRILIS